MSNMTTGESRASKTDKIITALLAPKSKWEHKAIDFVVGLPESFASSITNQSIYQKI